MKTSRVYTALVATVVATAASTFVLSETGHRPSHSSPSGKVAPWEAMKSAEAASHGRAVSANFEYEDGHWIYSVIVVAGKQLKEAEIDAQTGKVGDIESISPAGEANELKSDLQRALSTKK